MSKYFVINPNRIALSEEDIEYVENRKLEKNSNGWKSREEKINTALSQKCNLKHVHGRIIVKVDLEKKNYHTFSDGTKIRRERNFNDFNRRITQPVNGIVVSGENIPTDAEILFNHNSLHDSNKIFSYKSDSPDVQYFSLPDVDCYAWLNENGEPQPMKDFAFGLRVFKPYEGAISGIEPEFITDVLYMTTGHLKGLVVHTLKASDYELVYQGLNGKEGNIIRVRHCEEKKYFEREEIIGVRHDLTEKVLRGTYLIGLSKSDVKPLENQCSMTPT